MTSSPLLPWYSLNFAYVPSLALACIQAIVLMMVCHSSPSRIDGQFISTTGTKDVIGSGGSGVTTSFSTLGTFLFHTIGSSVLVAFSD